MRKLFVVTHRWSGNFGTACAILLIFTCMPTILLGYITLACGVTQFGLPHAFSVLLLFCNALATAVGYLMALAGFCRAAGARE